MAICAIALSIASCKKNSAESAPDEISPSTLAQIQALGFSNEGAQKVAGGYLVEGDIILSESDLKAAPQSPNLIVAKALFLNDS